MGWGAEMATDFSSLHVGKFGIGVMRCFNVFYAFALYGRFPNGETWFIKAWLFSELCRNRWKYCKRQQEAFVGSILTTFQKMWCYQNIQDLASLMWFCLWHVWWSAFCSSYLGCFIYTTHFAGATSSFQTLWQLGQDEIPTGLWAKANQGWPGNVQ